MDILIDFFTLSFWVWAGVIAFFSPVWVAILLFWWWRRRRGLY